MSDRPVDLSRGVRPFRQLQAYASQPLMSLFAEFERLEALVIALAHYSLPAELVESAQFSNLSEMLTAEPADPFGRPKGGNSLPGARTRTTLENREKRRAPAGRQQTASPSRPADDVSEESSLPGKQGRASTRQPVFPVGERVRQPGEGAGSARRDRQEKPATMPIDEDLNRAPSSHSSANDVRQLERDLPVTADRKRDEKQVKSASTTHRAATKRDEQSPPVVRSDAQALSRPAAVLPAGKNAHGWQLLDTLSHNLMQGRESDGSRGVMDKGSSASGSQFQRSPRSEPGRASQQSTAPVGQWHEADKRGAARRVIEQSDPEPVHPRDGLRAQTRLGERGPIDMDEVADWINELLRDQARRHGVHLE